MTELLARAREVNDVWLVGWGCHLERRPEFRVLENRRFSEYNTVYDIEAPEYVESAAHIAQQLGATLYLPRDSRFEGARKELAGMGWLPRWRTETLVSKVVDETLSANPDTTLRPVLDAHRSLEKWIDLYSRNYKLPSNLSTANQERWRLAFQSEPAIRFYFITVGGEPEGTAQMVVPGTGFCGVYSLSLPPRLRGTKALGTVETRLTQESVRLGAQWTCYERLRPVRKDPGLRPAPGTPLNFYGLEWHTLSSDTGYFLEA